MKAPWAWVCWLVSVLVVLSTTRNPLYLLEALAGILFVGFVLQRLEPAAPRLFSPWKIAGWILLLAAVFNMLTSHFGETVIFTIPGNLPLISGNVTLEALAYGFINGLILTGMLLSFTALNLALPVRDLVSLVPRAFFPVAVVTSIAITYLPTTVKQFRQIREAQAIRGHQMRTLGDWLPLLMPLLVGGLEHAMQLAEAMTARGFASVNEAGGRRQAPTQLLMFLGVLFLAGGWLVKLAYPTSVGWLVILVGGVMILAGLWLSGTRSPRTAYHRRVFTGNDGLGIFGALLVMAVFLLPIPGIGKETLYYDPYPKLSLPAFSPLIGVVLFGLIIPGAMALKDT